MHSTATELPISKSAARPAPGIMARLREETRPQHERLERELGLGARAPARARVLELLFRFHGFFTGWEPAVQVQLRDEAFLTPRMKLPMLRRDLASLGLSPREIERIPVCPDPASFSCAAGAMGSLYVVEGSTLGGQIINRRLAGASWLPAEGLTYFRSYGPAVGEMWRAFRDKVEQTSSPGADDRMLHSARLTFARLESWLCRGM